MFLVDWFYDILALLGLWQKEANILILGLDNSGKTTLLHMLNDERLVQHQPTQYPTSTEVSIGKIKFKVFELGERQIARQVCKDHNWKVDAVVYLIDVCNWGRFDKSRSEFRGLFSDVDFANVPILILGNKIDRPDAVDEIELYYEIIYPFGDYSYADFENRPIKLFMCSILQNQVYVDGFKWLSQNIK